MNKKIFFIWEIIKLFVMSLAIVIPIRYFLFQPFVVKGDSMLPNFNSGDYLIVDEISYRFKNPERGDVIVFKYPQNPSYRFIKRIIGLPGETIEIKNNEVAVYSKDEQKQILNETLYIPDSKKTYGDIRIKLKENEYFVLGDNRPYSSDSRSWGPLPKENIIGKVFIRLFPFGAIDLIGNPNY